MCTVAVVYSIIWILVSIKFVKWRNWKDYYPTVLFAALGDLLYEYICYTYPMWQMEPNGLPNSTIPALLLSIIGMPLSTMVFLSNYPLKSLWTKILYILFFVFVFIVLEHVAVRFGSITYHHGWNLGWSTLFVVVMFPMLRIHYRNPLLALLLSSGFIVFLCFVFDLTFDKMK